MSPIIILVIYKMTESIKYIFIVADVLSGGRQILIVSSSDGARMHHKSADVVSGANLSNVRWNTSYDMLTYHVLCVFCRRFMRRLE